jgi:hypothetical protein
MSMIAEHDRFKLKHTPALTMYRARSSGWTQSSNVPIRLQVASTVRSAAFLSKVFSLEKIFSPGLRLGL